MNIETTLMSNNLKKIIIDLFIWYSMIQSETIIKIVFTIILIQIRWWKCYWTSFFANGSKDYPCDMNYYQWGDSIPEIFQFKILGDRSKVNVRWSVRHQTECLNGAECSTVYIIYIGMKWKELTFKRVRGWFDFQAFGP